MPPNAQLLPVRSSGLTVPTSFSAKAFLLAQTVPKLLSRPDSHWASPLHCLALSHNTRTVAVCGHPHHAPSLSLRVLNIRLFKMLKALNGTGKLRVMT